MDTWIWVIEWWRGGGDRKWRCVKRDEDRDRGQIKIWKAGPLVLPSIPFFHFLSLIL